MFGLLIAIERRGAIPLVRLAGIDPIQAKAVLDSGAAGVLVPMVNTKEEAAQVVQMTKYPPLGSRGICLARAQEYGENFDEYVSHANDGSLLIVYYSYDESIIGGLSDQNCLNPLIRSEMTRIPHVFCRRPCAAIVDESDV